MFENSHWTCHKDLCDTHLISKNVIDPLCDRSNRLLIYQFVKFVNDISKNKSNEIKSKQAIIFSIQILQ